MMLCSYFDQNLCRSCSLIEVDYDSQIQKKEFQIKTALAFLGEVPLVGPVRSQSLGFRNRAKMGVTGSVDHPVVGLLGKDRLDEGREILSCPIHHEKLNQIIAALPQFIRDYNLIPYSIQARKGELKGVILFYAPESDEAYLRFILRSKECVSRIKKGIPTIQKQFSELKCVTANIQPVPHAIQEGPEEIYLTGCQTLRLQIGKIVLNLSPHAFVQTNIRVATQLYETAAEWIIEAQSASGLAGQFRVLELFCGQGAFSLVAVNRAGRDKIKFLGLEINPGAVASASETARDLGLEGCVEFQVADATRVAPQIETFQPHHVLVNPPRRGLGEGVQLLKKARPQHFIYSSCSLESLAKDLQHLAEDYSLTRVQLFDMFPHTEHFEVLVWLQRREVIGQINY
jgi:23S rRNA (uracil747-C5)-methyltransferase